MIKILSIAAFIIFSPLTFSGQNLPDTDLAREFASPSTQYRPETWFHLMGNNITKEGLTRDLNAIHDAGLQGIHLFTKRGPQYPGVKQIEVLTPEWEEMIRHTADLTSSLDLKLTLQNCPGWSMTGGPWVPAAEAQRELVYTTFYFDGGKKIDADLTVNPDYLNDEYDYKDVTLLAFPNPDERRHIKIPNKITTNNSAVPWQSVFDPEDKKDWQQKDLSKSDADYKLKGTANNGNDNTWVALQFDKPVTLRSLLLSPIREMVVDQEYPFIDVSLNVFVETDGKYKLHASRKIPDSNWQDRRYDLTLAIPEVTTDKVKIEFSGQHNLFYPHIYLSSLPRLHNYEAKAATTVRDLQIDTSQTYDGSLNISPEDVVDLSSFLNDEGKLVWRAPKGEWKVVRIGHVNMRVTNKPAPPEATGWEASKLDKEAIENHLRNGMIGNLLRPGGPLQKNQLHGLLIDSWESFVPNWTMVSDRFFEEFKSRRGYEMKPYMPALMGHILGDPQTTEKFLRDIRATMDELYIDNFFSHFRTISHEFGAKVYTEGAGGEVLPADALRYYGVSDIPMTEFWYPKSPSAQKTESKSVLPAASATHLYNKPFLAAEACTQLGVRWNEHPYSVKSLIDFNFTKGINHLVFHTFSHTPQVEVYPGSTFGGHIGFPLVRNQTWWRYMPAWTDYLSRIQLMLQQGTHSADVLWYLGDDFERPPYDNAAFPVGHKFDYLNTELLQTRVSTKNGRLHVEGAGAYKVLKLRDSNRMLLSTLNKIESLVKDGAVVLGNKPQTSPSLMDNMQDINTLRTTANTMWGDGLKGVKSYGKGRVYWGYSLTELLNAEKITADVIVPNELQEKVHWIHKRTEDKDIYFVSSQHNKAIDVALSFRLSNVYPEIWNPLSGTKHAAQFWNAEGDRTNVAIQLDPSGSTVIIFQKNSSTGNKSLEPWTKLTFDGQTVLSTATGWYRLREDNTTLPNIYTKNEKFYSDIGGQFDLSNQYRSNSVTVKTATETVNKGWSVAFTEGWGAPESIQLGALMPLNSHSHDGVKHYSGTSTYTKTVNIDPALAQNASGEKVVLLDLGEVHNIAEVRLNDQLIGTKWAPPFTFDITEQLRPGDNTLEVLVTNTWRNQLIRDRLRPNDQKKTWTSNPPEPDDTTLDSAGLIGPVVIKSIQAQ